jgi:hypothetical protein
LSKAPYNACGVFKLWAGKQAASPMFKLQQQMERITQLPRTKQKFVM